MQCCLFFNQPSPGDNIMEAGEYNDELLILAKGVGRTTDKDPLTQTYRAYHESINL